MTIPDRYKALAPADLAIYRTFRYDGGGFDISLRDLAIEDVQLISRVYTKLKELYNLWLYMGDQPNYDLLRERLTTFGDTEFIRNISAIGEATYAAGRDDEALHNAVHDIRGGALTSLTGYARLLPRLPNQQDFIRQAVYLARDHAKMLRNILPDLDKDVRAADEGLKLHALKEFVDKWNDFTFELPQQSVTVQAQTYYDGFVTSRCLETSAVDRILYNYINNAARFTADHNVKLTVIPAGNEMVRWIIENKINDDQESWLGDNVGPDLTPLFEGGYTRGGHGIGLKNCANFVSTSFGISNDEALAGGYLGAKVVKQRYIAWFHWPIYVKQNADEPVCDCGDH